MAVKSQALADSVAKAAGGKHLTFRLGEETYGVEILKVQEIIGMMNVTRVPGTPGFVRGVINLRGKVIPVVDLRAKFDLAEQEDTPITCIIVMQVSTGERSVTMGVIVDEVSEVVDIRDDEIEETPSFGEGVETDFILAMGKLAERVVMLLDIDMVLSAKEVELVERVGQEA